jgi:hypothetical protein
MASPMRSPTLTAIKTGNMINQSCCNHNLKKYHITVYTLFLPLAAGSKSIGSFTDSGNNS